MIPANSDRQPVGRIYTLFKNRKQNIFCYDIYGCTINRIYKKTYNMYISVFLVIAGDVFDVGNVPFERSPEAAISRGAAAGALVAIV